MGGDEAILRRNFPVKFLSLYFVVATLVAAPPLFAETHFCAQPAPEWDAIFQRTNGWNGADGDYAVRLSEDKILWLFSDTWIGEVRDGKRVNPHMINNSIGIQRGTNPGTAQVEFFYRTNGAKAGSFFLPEKKRGYFWPFAGIRTGDGVFIFLQNVENYKTGTPFGFRTFDTVLGHIANPDDDPMRWRIRQNKIPFAKFADDEKLMLGAGILRTKPFIYIYGTHTKTNENRHSELIVIRVRDTALGDFRAWEFFTEDGWKKSPRHLKSLGTQTASELSVTWLPALKKYALVQSDAIFGAMKISFSEQPEGPWSAPKKFFQTPESKWPGVFCYAIKAQPDLAQNDEELIISYAANTWSLSQVINDARLYWPRFVRVPVEHFRE